MQLSSNYDAIAHVNRHLKNSKKRGGMWEKVVISSASIASLGKDSNVTTRSLAHAWETLACYIGGTVEMASMASKAE